MAVPIDSVLADPVVIGRITGVYGVKGWLKVHSFTEPLDNFLSYQNCFIQRQGQWQPLAIEAGRQHGKGLVIKLPGVDDPEAARAFSGCDVAVTVAELPALDEDEFYWHELAGLQVFVDHAERGRLLLGRVDHLFETGANDVLVVRPCEGSIDQRERLLPYLPEQVVLAIDLDAGTLQVDWDPDF
jgi:16S rRNA processing protein RimM